MSVSIIQPSEAELRVEDLNREKVGNFSFYDIRSERKFFVSPNVLLL
jgi:hypothetical protein